MNDSSRQLIEKILLMNDEQLKRFLSNVPPESLDYLDILLEKIEKEYSE